MYWLVPSNECRMICITSKYYICWQRSLIYRSSYPHWHFIPHRATTHSDKHALPTKVSAAPSVLSSCDAIPKSVSFASPLVSRHIFAGFMSIISENWRLTVCGMSQDQGTQLWLTDTCRNRNKTWHRAGEARNEILRLSSISTSVDLMTLL